MQTIVDVVTGQQLLSGDLPIYVTLPDGGLALFDRVGQIEPEHTPRYKCVARRVASPEPSYPFTIVGEVEELAGEELVVTRQYAPDQGAYQLAIDNIIEETAQSRSYSSAVSLASYVSSSVPAWKAEAEAFVAWRDAVWVYTLGELAKVQAGKRQPPTLAELIAKLPAVDWPAD